MAGLNRKVLNSRRITKIMASSNPVFSRSFITSFGVAFYSRGTGLPQLDRPDPRFFLKDNFGHMSEKVYICTAKNNKTTTQGNESIFI